MLKETLLEFFERDLNKLKEEISLYKNEEDLWIVKNEVSNSAGNLALHLIGNLNHFIGSILGKTGYMRDRDSEFSSKNIPKGKIIEGIENVIPIVLNAIKNLSEEDFNNEFPVDKHGKNVKTDYMLVHLLTHLNYHLGQINYHRRLLD